MRKHDLAGLSEVIPSQLVSYLRVRGWHQEGDDTIQSAVWSKTDERIGEVEVDVLLDTSFRDYARRVADVLENLSIIEQRSQEAILRDILRSDRDCVRLRIAGKQIQEGRVSLQAGALFTSAAHNITATAARAASASSPAERYSGRLSKQVEDFLSQVTLSPPEAGSFVINIEVPVAPQLQLDFDYEDNDEDNDPPFERKVITAMAAGFAAAAEAVREVQSKGNAKAFEAAIARGLNANLCEALANILALSPVDTFDAEFAWSSNRPIPKQLPAKIRFAKDSGPVFKEAARKLRSKAPLRDFEVAGFPITLTAQDGSSASEGGTVIVMAPIENRPKKIHIQLAPEDYQLAIKAHRDSKAIQLEGELIRKKREHILTHYRHFEVLEDNE